MNIETPKIENCSLCRSEAKLYESCVEPFMFIECSNKSCAIRMIENHSPLKLIDVWNEHQHKIRITDDFNNS